eukprot:TRINITY_DN5875_c0_g2_i1.p1 TRINITY_DN5875_c0_g2~~TRINITY_DN5875_c0_g2_i1.p1  ORF type:complete len:238 (+),score=37.78 TRINITY_DN5875_c0_g2_i1:35-715(+)
MQHRHCLISVLWACHIQGFHGIRHEENVNLTRGTCKTYVAPADYKVLDHDWRKGDPNLGGIEQMERLTDPNWHGKSTSGADVLFYSYGPAWTGTARPQVAAYKYNSETGEIDFWYARRECFEMCASSDEKCCRGADGFLSENNWPSWLSAPLAIKGTFGENSEISTKFGKLVLKKLMDPERWRVGTALKDGRLCFLDHVYACAKSLWGVDYVAKGKLESGVPCDIP